MLSRCDSHWSKLDGETGGRRSHGLTEALFEALGPKALWNDYGIVDNILVSHCLVVLFHHLDT